MKLLEWDAGPEYAVAFSTRQGGVSEGPFESLNLGKLTLDEAENVEENRRRLCAAIGVEPDRLAFNRQQHSALVHRAQSGARGEPGDGVWSDEPGVPMLAFTADCVPVAIAREGRPALAVLHVGWRGLLAGIVAEGVGALGAAARAAVGPAIGPCCYEVGDEVAAPFRERFGSDVLARRESRPLDRVRAGAPGGGRREGRALRSLHVVQPGALLLASPGRRRDRPPGSDRPCCRLRRSATATRRSAPRLADASPSSLRRSTSMRTSSASCGTRASRSSARTERRISRRSTRATATRSAGTSSGICRAARRERSTRRASFATRSPPSRPRDG